MSTYEDYADASNHYDGSRVPVGVEIILGAMAVGPTPLADVHLLDAGCGTGNYAVPLAAHVGDLTLVDGSEDMLEVAMTKLASIDGAARVDAHHATLQALPFDDGSFDAVMTNQVLHHLGDPNGDEWPEHRKVFAEYARVLRPGGVLVLNTCSGEQVRQGWWAFSLIPTGCAEMIRRYAPLDVLEGLAAETGLTPSGRFVPTDATIQGSTYFDPEGPLSADWRRADSTWSLAPDAEIETMIATVTDLKERGELDDYVAEHDARRPDVGQTTFLVARRL